MCICIYLQNLKQLVHTCKNNLVWEQKQVFTSICKLNWIWKWAKSSFHVPELHAKTYQNMYLHTELLAITHQILAIAFCFRMQKHAGTSFYCIVPTCVNKILLFTCGPNWYLQTDTSFCRWTELVFACRYTCLEVATKCSNTQILIFTSGPNW